MYSGAYKEAGFFVKPVTKKDEEYLIQIMNLFQQILAERVQSAIERKDPGVSASGDFDAELYAGIKVSISLLTSRYAKSCLRSAKSGDEEIDYSSLLPQNPLCSWRVVDYEIKGKSLFVKVLLPNQPAAVRRKKTYMMELRPVSEKTKEDPFAILKDKQLSTLTIEYVNGQFWASIRYVEQVQKEEKKQVANKKYTTRNIRIAENEIAELMDRKKKLRIRKAGLVNVFTYFLKNPVVVLRRLEPSYVTAPNEDVADCMDVFLKELDIRFLRKKCEFTVMLSEDHFMTICERYIGDKTLFMKGRETGKAKDAAWSLAFPVEDFEIYSRIIIGGNSDFIYEMPFHPAVADESEEMNHFTALTEDGADRFEELFRNNRIPYRRNGMDFSAHVTPEGLRNMYRCVDGLRPRPVEISVMKEWIFEEYGVKFPNYTYAEIKKKYGFYSKHSESTHPYDAYDASSGRTFYHRCKPANEMIIVKCFMHFGMIGQEEGTEILKELEKQVNEKKRR